MELARGKKHRLARRQLDHVEQQRRENADVARVPARELTHPARGGIGTAAPVRPRYRARDRRSSLRPRERPEGFEEHGEAASVRACSQRNRKRRQSRLLERGAALCDLAWLAEAIERMKWRQRADQLGLGIRIAITAIGRVERDSRAVLARETLLRLGGVGMCLDRQRCGGGEDLEAT